MNWFFMLALDTAIFAVTAVLALCSSVVTPAMLVALVGSGCGMTVSAIIVEIRAARGRRDW